MFGKIALVAIVASFTNAISLKALDAPCLDPNGCAPAGGYVAGHAVCRVKGGCPPAPPAGHARCLDPNGCPPAPRAGGETSPIVKDFKEKHGAAIKAAKESFPGVVEAIKKDYPTELEAFRTNPE